MFLIALLFIRISGMRPFGKENGVDTIISFLIGSILGKGVVGATPFFSAVMAVAVILFVHIIMVKLSLYNQWMERELKALTCCMKTKVLLGKHEKSRCVRKRYL